MSVGKHVSVSGTTVLSVKHGIALIAGSAAKQASCILEHISSALEKAGATIDQVIRTRIFVTNIARDSEAVADIHRTWFLMNPPACTMVEVSRLIDKRLLVEAEAYAIII